MAIEWYPGHMVAARKQAAEALRKTDAVIEVLDARVPYSSCNPVIEKLRRECQRPALKVFNKADLADPERTKQWLAFYNAQAGVRAIAVSCKQPRDVARIPEQALRLVPGRGTSAKPLRMMILGIPNVGKSTLMNVLVKRAVSKVGNEPAVTRTMLAHAVGKDMWITDTPGMLWPGIDPEAALKLAISHSIGQNAYDDDAVAVELGAYLLQHYPELLRNRFGALPEPCDAHNLVSHIASKRALVLKGGGPDLPSAARVLLNEFRSGTLGRISLESVSQLGPSEG
ncbi:MAG: ribosome biogenesis GTPase YlqF [Polyangiaceae bacterium]